jgi:phosphatidylglycerophosphate synthase
VAIRKSTVKKTIKKTGASKAEERLVGVDETAPLKATTPKDFTPALCIIGDDTRMIFGRTVHARIHEQFKRAGLVKVVAQSGLANHHGPIILVNANGVLDQPLIDVILKRPNMVLVSEHSTGSQVLAANVRLSDVTPVVDAMTSGQKLEQVGLLVRAPSELEANFWKALRKRETPYALPLTKDNQTAVEWRMFMGTYKGATDIVTKHLWPRPAFHVTRWLAPRGVTPNMVTTVGAVMTLAAFYLFFQGQFIWGLVAAWMMTFLDTVDGKLARTTLSSSKWGDIFDHGIDLIHPPFWYMAWGYGLIAWGIAWSNALFWWTIAIILAGYVLQRIMEGIAIKWLGLEIHIWRPIDTLFRQITARRNPNLILLTLFTLMGKPDWGLLAVAAWTGICLLLHGVQLAQGLAAKKTGEPLQSWMTKP